TTLTLLGMALILRPLVLQTVDPVFARSQSRHGWLIRSLFMILVVLNLIAGFRALGTLMAVGLMIVPATAARYWVNALTPMVVLAFVFGAGSGLLGLALSFWLDSVPSGPGIILVAGLVFLVSLAFGQNGLDLLGRLSGRRTRSTLSNKSKLGKDP
ncbi:MAG: metal ABC transporter permease, partial [Pseudomonadota bacterium]|nr:metal ABC transporter permease [Pseudomonadota bacterium]